MKPSVIIVLVLFSTICYSQSSGRIFKDTKPDPEQTFKYYPEKTLSDVFKKETKPQALARLTKDRPDQWPMPVAKPDENFKSNMPNVKPDSSVHHTMRILKPE